MTDPSGEIDIYDLAQILASYEGAGDNTAKVRRVAGSGSTLGATG